MNYVGIKLYNNPDLQGLKPDILSSFLKMAEEHFNLTKKLIQVNSAKRNGSGNSVHDYGYAIDINTVDANSLEKLGLLKKYGFHRPLLNWSKTGISANKKDEPWHIEYYPGEKVYGARNTINNDYRINILMKKAK